MPKIVINEVDNTGLYQTPELNNTVYIPGTASAPFEPTLCRTVKELQATGASSSDASYKIAKKLIELGLTVLYEGFVFESGETEPSVDWTKLQDKALYNVRFLTTGAYACPSTDMINCAAKRGDCVALLDHPEDMTGESGSTQVEKVRKYFEDLKSSTAENNSYASAFTPWFTASLDNVDVKLPASIGYLFAYARSIQNNPTWFAAAGSIRGKISELKSVDYKYSNADCEVLQARSSTSEVDLDNVNDNKGYAINPIAYRSGFGYLIWGNRTFRENNGECKATSYLNVRNLISDLKKKLYSAATKYTFEQNDEVLWVNFKSEVTPLLDQMKSSSGLKGDYGFVKVLTPGKKARLSARISITPIEGVEDFVLDVYLFDSTEEGSLAVEEVK